MKPKFITMFLFAFCCSYADAAVLDIFESTNFPTDITEECHSVHRFEIVDNELYTATEKGIYKYSESANSWSCWSMENTNVIDFKVSGDNIVAITVPEKQNEFSGIVIAKLVRFNISTGISEDIMDENMGYFYYDQFLTYVMRMAQHPTHPTTLMVVAYPGIWISEDFGTTWNFKIDWLYGYNQNQFLGWHPMKDNVLFYASESPIFAAQILRSEDYGENWDIISPDKKEIIPAIILLLIQKTPTISYIRAKDVSLSRMTAVKHGIVFTDKITMTMRQKLGMPTMSCSIQKMRKRRMQ